MKILPLKNSVTYAKDQPEYVPLPALKREGKEGAILICWKLSWFERIQVLIFGKLWHQILTFNADLQPILITSSFPKEWKELAK